MLFHAPKRLKLKRLITPNISKDVEQLELSYIVFGSIKWYIYSTELFHNFV